jgi:hypothetical protein
VTSEDETESICEDRRDHVTAFRPRNNSAGVRNVPLRPQARYAGRDQGETARRRPNEATIIMMITFEKGDLISPTTAELELVQQTTASIEGRDWTERPLTTGEKLCIEMAVLYTLAHVDAVFQNQIIHHQALERRTTISCCGLDITVACDDIGTKTLLMGFLTGTECA